MFRILGMIAQFKRPHGILGLLAALFQATQVAAYPLDNDELAARGGASRNGVAALPAVADVYTSTTPADVLRLLPATATATAKANAGAWSTGSSLGVDSAAPVPLFVDPLPADRQGEGLASPEQADPLGRALRSLVNVSANRPQGASAAGVVLPAAEVDQVTPFLVEDIAAGVLKMEEGLAEIITEVLDARVDDEGRVTFSLAGVEGFHITTDGGKVSLGYGDTLFAFNRAKGAQLERRISALDAVRDAEQRPHSSISNPLRDLVELGQRVVQYPLFWVLVILALIGKVALAIANSRKRRRSRRLNSGGEQPKAKSTRTRTRIRLKRLRTRIRLQQSA
jgi:hypothetical protein